MWDGSIQLGYCLQVQLSHSSHTYFSSILPSRTQSREQFDRALVLAQRYCIMQCEIFFSLLDWLLTTKGYVHMHMLLDVELYMHKCT